MVTMHQRQKRAWQDTQPREIEPKDLLRHYPKAWPSCVSNCDQGRKLCPCPDACQKPEDGSLGAATGVLIWIIGGLASWGAVIALIQWLKS